MGFLLVIKKCDFYFSVIKNNYVIQGKKLLNKKYLKPSQPDHKIFLPSFSKAPCRAVVQQSCQAAASDGRAPGGPRVCVPVLWDQGTACQHSDPGNCRKKQEEQALPFLSPQSCSFQRGSCSGADSADSSRAGCALCAPPALAPPPSSRGISQLLFSRAISAAPACCWKELGNCRIIQAEGTPGSL